MTDQPLPGKTYALTGARGTRCIANGNSWAESEVQGEHAVTIDWGQEKQERRTYTFASAAEKQAFIKGVEEGEGWLRYLQSAGALQISCGSCFRPSPLSCWGSCCCS